MASEHDNRLLPLRREFGQAWHGFDRNQVLHYLDYLEAQVYQVLAERDSAVARATEATRELTGARQEIDTLRQRVEELKKPPERVEDLDERMQRTVALAQNRASEILANAEAAAEKTWAQSSEVSSTLHERYQKLLETLDGHAEALKHEHEDALAATKAEVGRMTTDAARRREELDTEAEARRRAIEDEFQAKLTAERNAVDKQVADETAASKSEAERRVTEATQEAERLVAEATQKAERLLETATTEANRRTAEADGVVARLTKIREDARARLQEADVVLQESESALTPIPEENSEVTDTPNTSS